MCQKFVKTKILLILLPKIPEAKLTTQEGKSKWWIDTQERKPQSKSNEIYHPINGYQTSKTPMNHQQRSKPNHTTPNRFTVRPHREFFVMKSFYLFINCTVDVCDYLASLHVQPPTSSTWGTWGPRAERAGLEAQHHGHCCVKVKLKWSVPKHSPKSNMQAYNFTHGWSSLCFPAAIL